MCVQSMCSYKQAMCSECSFISCSRPMLHCLPLSEEFNLMLVGLVFLVWLWFWFCIFYFKAPLLLWNPNGFPISQPEYVMLSIVTMLLIHCNNKPWLSVASMLHAEIHMITLVNNEDFICLSLLVFQTALHENFKCLQLINKS